MDPIKSSYASEAAFARDDPKTFAILKEIYRTAQAGNPVQLSQVKKWQHQAGDLFDVEKSAGNSKILWGGIKDWLQDPSLESNLIGPQRGIAVKALAAGDELHKRFKNSALLDQYMQQAKLKAGKNYTQAMSATAIRQKFGELAMDLAKEPTGKSKMGRFLNQDQKDQINRLVEGTPAMNRAKELSSLNPLSFKGMGAGGIAHYLASSFMGPAGSAAIAAIPPVVGTAAKIAYPILTKREARKAIELIKRGNPVPGTPSYFPKPSASNFYPPLLPASILGPYLTNDGSGD
jgi:hypothetical protein